ncbi:SDR family NAD(P)-dependent oxidoreductase [Lactococcus lactis]|uniref:SDR family NAD(P)-dependent oxidoreductase n=1 Tax=Lactococcus lactis TaxID=1358 RepID=UPI000C9F92CD|nr:SDR family NAD(P)-dependent oxidoreductase [Lactococcus lactis]AUS70633.1 oxidoreductase [Lactococcus lactis subsp. lactis]
MSNQEPIANYKFNYKTTANKVMKNINLSGKTIIITGGYSGIGLEMTKQLSRAGAKIIIPARRMEVAKKNLSKIKNIDILPLDLTTPESIHQFAESFLQNNSKLDILINSAGLMYLPLKNAKNSRVINLSSRAQQMTPLLEDWNFEKIENYNPQIGYQQSKTANVLFSIKLDELGKKYGIRSFAVHPGMIPMTNIGRQNSPITPWLRYLADYFKLIHIPVFFNALKSGFDRSKYRYLKTIAQGAATPLWASTSPDLEGKGGLYCEDLNIARLMTSEEVNNFSGGLRPHAIDHNDADRLWQISKNITGLDFE